jgi:hypothetical protein
MKLSTKCIRDHFSKKKRKSFTLAFYPHSLLPSSFQASQDAAGKYEQTKESYTLDEVGQLTYQTTRHLLLSRGQKIDSHVFSHLTNNIANGGT